jgi:hypothetical protein
MASNCLGWPLRACLIASLIRHPIFAHYENKGVEIAVARPWVARCAAVVIAGDVHGLPAQQEIGKVYEPRATYGP